MLRNNACFSRVLRKLFKTLLESYKRFSRLCKDLVRTFQDFARILQELFKTLQGSCKSFSRLCKDLIKFFHDLARCYFFKIPSNESCKFCVFFNQGCLEVKERKSFDRKNVKLNMFSLDA